MSTKFDTKEEAEAAVEELKKSPPEIWCPLSGTACKAQCPCFQMPRFSSQTFYEKDKPAVHWVYPASCDNAMFFNSCHGGC
jgi:hypothetical protein